MPAQLLVSPLFIQPSGMYLDSVRRNVDISLWQDFYPCVDFYPDADGAVWISCVCNLEYDEINPLYYEFGYVIEGNTNSAERIVITVDTYYIRTRKGITPVPDAVHKYVLEPNPLSVFRIGWQTYEIPSFRGRSSMFLFRLSRLAGSDPTDNCLSTFKLLYFFVSFSKGGTT